MECIEINERLAGKFLKPKSDYLNKSSAGRLAIVAGSRGICGAAVLSTLAALRSGSGYVTLATSEDVYKMVFPLIPEATFFILDEESTPEELACEIVERFADYDTLLVGCGMGKSDKNTKLLHNIIQNWQKPLVMDADALNCICRDLNIIKNKKCEMIMTPHPGEMSRLVGLPTDTVIQKRKEVAFDFSRKFGVTLVLKGFETVVASGENIFVINNPNSGLAKAGSGDVLAGLVGSLCAQGLPCNESAIVAVFLHNRAGEICSKRLSKFFMQPSDVINNLSDVFLEMNI